MDPHKYLFEDVMVNPEIKKDIKNLENIRSQSIQLKKYTDQILELIENRDSNVPSLKKSINRASRSCKKWNGK